MITLRSERLEIQIQEPGSRYRRARFDWGGICEQVTLDGAVPFCSQEADGVHPSTDGVGLIDEFGIVTPIGYRDVGPGAWFPKIGIGFLQKTSDIPYSFFDDFPVEPAPYQVVCTDSAEVVFTQAVSGTGGWAWRLQKTFSVSGAGFTIAYTLENLGEKPFVTEQYNHNFFAIAGQPVGPDYALKTSFPLNCPEIVGGIHIAGSQLTLTEIPVEDIYTSQADCQGLTNVAWELVHTPSGHGVKAREVYPLFKFALWGKSHVISPEFFYWIDLQPGEATAWQRTYDFF